MTPWLVAFASSCVVAAAHPAHARCPPAWHDLDGARPSGVFHCRPDVVDAAVTMPDGSVDPHLYDGAGGFSERGHWPEGLIRLRACCLPHTHPEVDCDGRGVHCLADGSETQCHP